MIENDTLHHNGVLLLLFLVRETAVVVGGKMKNKRNNSAENIFSKTHDFIIKKKHLFFTYDYIHS